MDVVAFMAQLHLSRERTQKQGTSPSQAMGFQALPDLCLAMALFCCTKSQIWGMRIFKGASKIRVGWMPNSSAKGISLHRWEGTETLLTELLKTPIPPQHSGYHSSLSTRTFWAILWTKMAAGKAT